MNQLTISLDNLALDDALGKRNRNENTNYKRKKIDIDLEIQEELQEQEQIQEQYDDICEYDSDDFFYEMWRDRKRYIYDDRRNLCETVVHRDFVARITDLDSIPSRDEYITRWEPEPNSDNSDNMDKESDDDTIIMSDNENETEDNWDQMVVNHN